jgi:hypothetical protein
VELASFDGAAYPVINVKMSKEPPVRVTPKPYRGRDPRKLANYRAQLQAAERLEQYLAEQYIVGKPRSLTYHNIALETGVDFDTVKELLFRARGGNNGITI